MLVQMFKTLIALYIIRKSFVVIISGPAPRGGIPGPCPPKSLLVPPKWELCPPPPSEDCAPKKLTGLVLLECNWRPEAKILVITLEFVSKNCFFVDFAINTVCFCGVTPEFMKIRVYFGTKTFSLLFLFCFLVFTSEFVEIRVEHFFRLVHTLAFK